MIFKDYKTSLSILQTFPHQHFDLIVDCIKLMVFWCRWCSYTTYLKVFTIEIITIYITNT